jgi:1,2-phenylacetyl-CoA epoxidase PaaB subunit
MANDRYVVPNGEGGWDVVKEGHLRATAHATTKAKAIAQARRLVRRDGGGEVWVMNQAGKVTESDTVRPRESSGRRAAA